MYWIWSSVMQENECRGVRNADEWLDELVMMCLWFHAKRRGAMLLDGFMG